MKPEQFQVLCDEALARVKPIDSMTEEELREHCRIYRGALLQIAADNRFGGWQCDADCPNKADTALFCTKDPAYAADLERWRRTP